MADLGVPQVDGELGDTRAGYYFAQYDWERVGLRLGYEKFDLDGAMWAQRKSR